MTRWPISARPLSDGQIAAALEHIAATSERPLRDELVLWLNVSAGLRAHEIAGLELSTVWEREGSVRDVIHIDRRLAKYSSARAVIVSARVREALLRFRAGYPDAKTVGDSFGERPTPVVRQQIEALRRKIGYRETPLGYPRFVDGATRVLADGRKLRVDVPDEAKRSPQQRKPGFRASDLSRAVAAARRAGLEVTVTELTSDGGIRLSHGSAEPSSQSAYDAWKERRDARSV
jgi:integrase